MSESIDRVRGIGDRAAPPIAAGQTAVAEFRPAVRPALELAARPFDLASVRREFPILEERLNGHPLVWLDNAATTQKPRAVLDRIMRFYEHENANVHRAGHTLGARATDAYEGAREKVRRFLNAASTEEIVFVRGATEAINLVAQTWGRRHIGKDDEIVVTWLEHHSNIVPWQQLAAEKNARLRVAPVDDRGQIVLDAFAETLGPRTKLVALSHVSNALGTVAPIEAMIRLAHERGARVLVDGAQAVPHLPVDVQALRADFYTFSGHKAFGPTGVGVLYGQSNAFEESPPWHGGGHMVSEVTFERTVFRRAPSRFEAGTGSIADAVGLGAALDYLQALGLDNVKRHEDDLMERATTALSLVPGLRLVGTADTKAGVLSFVIEGLHPEAIGAALDRNGIAVRSGHHCAQPVLRRFGLHSTVRASLALYNSREDIEALARSIRHIVETHRRPGGGDS